MKFNDPYNKEFHVGLENLSLLTSIGAVGRQKSRFRFLVVPLYVIVRRVKLLPFELLK